MVDWLVWVGAICLALEVKMPDARTDFTKGETGFLTTCPGPVGVVSTTQEVIDIIMYVTNSESPNKLEWLTFGIPADHEITKARSKKWLHKS